MLDLLLPSKLNIFGNRLGILRHPEFWRNRYSVAVLPTGICTTLAQAKDGFGLDFPMISKHRLGEY